MRFNKLLATLGTGMALMAAQAAHAVDLYSDLAAWQTAVSSFQGTRVVSAGAEFSTPSQVVVSGGSTLDSFSSAIEKRVIGSGWATWPDQPGSNGTTVYFSTASTLSFDFTAGIVLEAGSPKAVDAFGFRIEPNVFAVYEISVALGTGETLTQFVDGSAGAAFFGWTGDGLTTVTITSDANANGFAFGEFYEGAAAVPEPSTYLLMAMGLIGLALMRRRQQ